SATGRDGSRSSPASGGRRSRSSRTCRSSAASPDDYLEHPALEEVRVVLQLRHLEAPDREHARGELAVLRPPVARETPDDQGVDPVDPLHGRVEAAQIHRLPEGEVRAVEEAAAPAAEVAGGTRILHRPRDVAPDVARQGAE